MSDVRTNDKQRPLFRLLIFSYRCTAIGMINVRWGNKHQDAVPWIDCLDESDHEFRSSPD